MDNNILYLYNNNERLKIFDRDKNTETITQWAVKVTTKQTKCWI